MKIFSTLCVAGNAGDTEKLEWYKKITEILKENEKSAPYADLPDSERNILLDLSDYIENNKPTEAARKLSELAGMLQEHNMRLKDVSERNRWLGPVSIMGFVLTLIFGLANIIF